MAVEFNRVVTKLINTRRLEFGLLCVPVLFYKIEHALIKIQRAG